MKFLNNLIGARVIKTGVSVFITALICLSFDLPAIYAVITAIVSTEPTTSDSIRKGMIRFPASAIGAALSLSLTSIFGESAITYAFSAILTIMVCYRLKLNDGILVATLTAVAMIPDTSTHFMMAFFIRLGTTSIGIIVSTLVNLLILPPDYTPQIKQNINGMFSLSARVLKHSISCILNKEKKEVSSKSYRELTATLERTFELADFQRKEYKFHRHKGKEGRDLISYLKELKYLQHITYHLGNLQDISVDQEKFTEKDNETLLKAADSISFLLQNRGSIISEKHYEIIEELDKRFWEWKRVSEEGESLKYHHHFAPQTIILFELLSIHDEAEEVNHFLSKNKYY